jgi:hypothetical protein
MAMSLHITLVIGEYFFFGRAIDQNWQAAKE